MPCSFELLVEIANKYVHYENNWSDLSQSARAIQLDLSQAYNNSSPVLIKKIIENYKNCTTFQPSFFSLLLYYIQSTNRPQKCEDFRPRKEILEICNDKIVDDNSKLELLENQIKELKYNLDIAKLDNHQLLENDIKELKNELDVCTDLKNQQQQICNTEILKLNNEIIHLKQIHEINETSLQMQLDEKIDEHENNQQQKFSSQNYLETEYQKMLENEKKAYILKVNEIETQCKRISEALDACDGKLKIVNEIENKYNSKIDQILENMSAEYSQLKFQNQECESNSKSLEIELQKSATNINSYTQLVQKLNIELTEKDEQIIEVNKYNDNLEEKLKGEQDQIKQHKINNSTKENEILELRSNLQTVEQHLASQQSIVTSLKRDLSKLQNSVAPTEGNIFESLLLEFQQKENEVVELKKEVNAVNVSNDDKEKRLEFNTKQMDTLKEEIGQQAEEIKSLLLVHSKLETERDIELEKLRNEKEKRESEIVQLKDSQIEKLNIEVKKLLEIKESITQQKDIEIKDELIRKQNKIVAEKRKPDYRKEYKKLAKQYHKLQKQKKPKIKVPEYRLQYQKLAKQFHDLEKKYETLKETTNEPKRKFIRN